MKLRHKGPLIRLFTMVSMRTQVFGLSFLTEDDVFGSSLQGKEPNRLKNSELKFWLRCRGDSLKGLFTKTQLCKR